jgi:hypothetical protein
MQRQRISRSPAAPPSVSSRYIYVCTRLHTSAYVCIRQHSSAYVRIRPHTSAYVIAGGDLALAMRSTRQHTSAYVSIREHTS